MNFRKAIKILREELELQEPDKINPTWIHKNCQSAYLYFWKHIKTELGEIDWDLITSKLDKYFQVRWSKYGIRRKKKYESRQEVDIILEKFKNKLYTFLSAPTKRELKIQDKLIVKLVRISQKGNVLAQKELIGWLSYTIEEWIDKYPQIHRWMNYRDEVDEKVVGCIMRYRYTGSFLGYLYKTLELSALQKPPLVSLDDHFLNGSKRRVDYVKSEEDYTSIR